jgi:hypothetical protein
LYRIHPVTSAHPLDADMEVYMGAISPNHSRRAFLGAFAATSATVVAAPSLKALDREFAAWGDEPITLTRTEKGRSSSEFRYHNAEEFFAGTEAGFRRGRDDLLYQTGIVLQLGLSSHLLDVGFDDQWCARHIGHRVAKSLAYANATGLGHRGAEIELLAAILTPYWKWNGWSRHSDSKSEDGPFSHEDIRRLTRNLLDHVRHVTGHKRPSSRGSRYV